MRLVITEKPSVARDLGRVLGANRKMDGYLEGNDLRISWCFGHMCELVDPEEYEPAWKRWSLETLPMVPENFRLRVREDAREHWAVLSKLIKDRSHESVINACDAGREGELIFRYAYELAGGRAPVWRLWVSSMTDQAIKAAWNSMRPAANYDALADAARCRSEADWLVGLNATRAMTCLARQAGGEQLLTLGRVQTPTLAMIVGRDREIAQFIPEEYWRVEAELAAEGGQLTGRWFRHDKPDDKIAGKEQEGTAKEEEEEAPQVERLNSAGLAEELAAALRNRGGRVIESERREKRERPPLLFDLTSLQRRANQRYGMSAEKTLNIAQGLYEQKLITYPRTDACYLTDDQRGELPGILRGLEPMAPYQACIERLLAQPLRLGPRIINPAEVGDHHAILPTGLRPNAERMNLDEKRIFDLVARRLLAALSPDAVFDLTRLVVSVEEANAPTPLPSPPRLRARGRVCRERGWQEIESLGARKERELPLLAKGSVVRVQEAKSLSAMTRPPRPHNDASLLFAMETAGKNLEDAELKRAMRAGGLGTPATRAATLETLVKRGFVERQGKDLRATPRGIDLIRTLGAEELKSPELTGRWEARLHRVAEGNESRSTFMADVKLRLGSMIEELKAGEAPTAERSLAEGPSLGACPRCAQPVKARRGHYACEGGCGFKVWGTIAKREISGRMVRQLLKEGETPSVKGFKSKAGKTFEAGLRLNENFEVVFAFPEGRAGAPPKLPQLENPLGLPCPVCAQGTVIAGRSAWGCSNWRTGCTWKVAFQENGMPVDPREVARSVQEAARVAPKKA